MFPKDEGYGDHKRRGPRGHIELAGCWHLAAGLLLLLPAIAEGQTVAATIPVGTSPVAIAVNPITNKTYIAKCGARQAVLKFG